jgi:hypothetical protein
MEGDLGKLTHSAILPEFVCTIFGHLKQEKNIFSSFN